MSELFDFLLDPQTAVVFDIDGVLAVYEFGTHCHSACADADWETYVRTHDPYASTRPVPEIQRFVRAKGPKRVYACSVAADFEAQGKRDFVLANYGIAPDHICLVERKPQKMDFLQSVADNLALPRDHVALVEDTVKTLDAACEKGFATVHVTSFFGFNG
ncbi:hypothetical protein [Parafannyhessea umbonata]|uniref:Uncharacterized protein n=1 Tax=Parafannyhessea umbonata TaxID=604330 RepID=A0A6N7XC09_9ACTN|nr:hypothetical protein [Parafannyhessea umbonata]MST60817.1 hypothetical protein [Parafannyhessea umbonata]